MKKAVKKIKRANESMPKVKKADFKTVGKAKGAAPKMKKAPTRKALIGKQANLPKELRDKIMASPATMLKPAAMKMMKKPGVRMMKKK